MSSSPAPSGALFFQDMTSAARVIPERISPCFFPGLEPETPASQGPQAAPAGVAEGLSFAFFLSRSRNKSPLFRFFTVSLTLRSAIFNAQPAGKPHRTEIRFALLPESTPIERSIDFENSLNNALARTFGPITPFLRRYFPFKSA